MGHTRAFVTLAGAAVGLGCSAALAQSTSLDQTRAYAAELTADAQGRSSLLTDGAATDKSSLLHFQNGDATLDIGGQFQFRNTFNFRDAESMGDEDFTWGHEIRRMKFWFDGDLNETWSYKFQFATNRDGGGVFFEEGWADWHLNDNWTLRGGQFKVPTLREELISSKYQQFADRSLTNEIFNLDRTQGLMLIYEGDQFNLYLSVNDGSGNTSLPPSTSGINVPFESMAEADIGLTGRGEWFFAGDKSQLDDFAGWQNQDYAGALGGAIHYQTGGETGGPTADFDLYQITVDVQVEGGGWNAFAAGIWNHVEPEMGDDADTFGIVAQGGFFATPELELFGRWDIIIPDSDAAADDPFNTLSAGGTYYFIPNSHASKLTLDVQIFLDDPADTDLVAGTDGVPGIGFLGSDDSGEVAIRCQYQLLF